MKPKIRNRLSVRLIVTISVILILILSIYTYISINNLEGYLTRNSFNHAYNVSDVIKKSTRYGMLLNRRQDVHEIIKTIGTEKDVKNIRIYNKQGLIIFSTDTSEILKKVNLKAEACVVCHNSAVPLNTLSNKDKMRIYTTPDNTRVLGLINPIENEEDCYNSDCHAHSPKIQFLGVLDVMISLEELDSIKAETTKSTIGNSVIITVVIAFVCGIFIVLLVNIPLRKLLVGMEEVGNGNLDYRISIKSQDELGKAAKRFNDMSSKLKEAHQSIKNWSETLNEKVNEKTEELKNIYSQVNQIEKLASLGKLSATVAHELNNPLEGILTYSKLISKKLQSQQTNGEHSNLIEYLNLISDESARCGKIVKDLLLFSHKDDSELVEYDINSLMDKSITLINHHLEIHKVKLHKNYEEKYPVVLCNPQKIQQAFMALLINAIESMPDGGNIFIKINEEYEHILIRIKDEGMGIPEKDIEHIFEPFYSTKEASKGTGLGLSVTYGIITYHKGELKVESTSTKGTCFKIILPALNKFKGTDNGS